MSQTGAERKVLEAMYNGALSPYGTGRMQMAGGTAYVAIPIELVDTLGLEQGAEIQRGYHAETDCLVMSLREDQNLFQLE